MRRACIVWVGLTGLAALAVGTGTATPTAGAAGATMSVTNVTYDPPSGPSDPNCVAPLPPKGGDGSASYNAPDGSYKSNWEWSIPAKMAAGATAHTKVSVQSFNNGGASAAIAMKPPGEFGTNAGARQQIIASVPPGAPGTATEQESYTFTPTRDFSAGEKLYVRVEIGCANFVYEYTGSAPPAPPPPAPTAAPPPSACAAQADCMTKEIAAPRPGGTATVTAPSPFATGASKSGVTVRGDLSGTTIVGEGEKTKSKAFGEAVAACWLVGPEALVIPPDSVIRSILAQESFKNLWKKAENNPRLLLRMCIYLVAKIAERPLGRPSARTAQGGCTAQRLAIRGRIRKGKVVSLKRVKTKATRSAVRYTCAAAPSGAIKLTVDGRRAGGLKQKLGGSLDLGVVRSPRTPASQGRLTFGFGPA